MPDLAPGVGTNTIVTNIGGGVREISGGEAVGGVNLFHSFTSFDLAAGDTARWTNAGATSFDNVINRVTGGDISHLSGLLDTQAFGDASIFFINPAGIIVGQGFNLNVPGALHLSTADTLTFQDGAEFRVATPNGSTLTTAEPQSFGFIGEQSGDIIFADGNGVGSAPSVFDISAPNVRFDHFTEKFINLVRIAAVGDGTQQLNVVGTLPSNLTGTFEMDSSLLGVTLDASAHAGDGAIEISAGTINVHAPLGGTTAGLGSVNQSGVQAGGFVLNAADILFDGAANVSTETTGAGGGASLTLNVSHELRIHGSGDLFDPQAQLATSTDGPGDAGALTINGADATIIFDGGSVSARSEEHATATGDAGDIIVIAHDLIMSTADVGASSRGNGHGGDVTITADTFHALDSFVASGTANSGDGGDITITAAQLIDWVNTFSRNGSGGDGDAGHTTITAPVINFSEGAAATAAAGGSGAAGLIEIHASNAFTLTSGAHVGAEGVNQGNAGAVIIEAGALSLSDAVIITDSDNANAGNITITLSPGSVLTLRNSRISTTAGLESTTPGPGEGGVITIANPLAIVSDGGSITALTQIGGANVHITAGYFLQAADAFNQLAVDGTLVLDSTVEDVARDTTVADVNFLDANRVLRGQCPAVRAHGQTSQLGALTNGPYSAPVPASGAGAAGACSVEW